MERVLEFLQVHSPDALLLQETKCSPEQFPAEELEAAGYEAVHHSGGRAKTQPRPSNSRQPDKRQNQVIGQPLDKELTVGAEINGLR